MRVTEIKEIFYPAELIEIRGKPPAEEFADDLGQYLELRDKRDVIFTRSFGLATLISLMYLIYHVISKIRGNEKNVQLNNFGIGLSLLILVNYSIFFPDWGMFTLAPDKKASWRHKHETL